MIVLKDKRITNLGQLSDYYNRADGLGHFRPDPIWVEDCYVDLAAVPLEDQDEAVSVTWGGSAQFHRCVFRNTGKLCLIGSGDDSHRKQEEGHNVTFSHCIFENFGRRGPEVQSGMAVIMESCSFVTIPSRRT